MLAEKRVLARAPEPSTLRRPAGRSNLAHRVCVGEPMKTGDTQSTFEGTLTTAPWNYKPKPKNLQGGTHFNPARRMLPKPHPTKSANPRGHNKKLFPETIVIVDQ